MKYSLSTENNNKGVLKIVLLAICLLCDIIAVAGIIGALSTKHYIQILWFVLLFVTVTVVQYVATFLTYKVSIVCANSQLEIKKIYPLKTVVVLKADIKDINLQPVTDYKSVIKAKNTYILCVNTCPYKIYMIELSGKKYYINSDEYMYSLLEDKNDIS